MHRTRIAFMFALIFALATAVVPTMSALAADRVTITGTVNDDFQVVTDDGQVYEIEENPKGDELIDEVGKRVKVTGTVEEEDGQKYITVTSYQILQ